MGQFLSEPDEEIHEGEGTGNGLTANLAYMQGWRKTQEDAHTVCMDIKELPGCSFAAVFDGHGGPQVSRFSADSLLANFLAAPTIKGNTTPTDAQIESGFQSAFLATDKLLGDDNQSDYVGTTAICALITKTDIFFINCGDSRAVLCEKDKVTFSTKDHKPSNVDELNRIKDCEGGYVANGRVMGNLAVSRALGDFQYKHSKDGDELLQPSLQMVSCVPVIDKIKRPSSFSVILACDGIWDVMSNEECAQFIWNDYGKDAATKEAKTTLSSLLKYCLHKESRDNMSVILVHEAKASSSSTATASPSSTPAPVGTPL